MTKAMPDVPLVKIFEGAMPFFFGALLVVALLVQFPKIVTWLPNLAFG